MAEDEKAPDKGRPPRRGRRSSDSPLGCLVTVLVVVLSLLSVVSFGGRHFYWMWIIALGLELGILAIAVLSTVARKWGSTAGLWVGFVIGLLALLGSCGANMAGSF